MTIRDQDIPRFSERLRMIEEAWLRTEDRLPVPALYAQGFTRGLVAGVAWASEQPDRESSDADFSQSELSTLEWCVSHLIEKSPFSQLRVDGRVVTFADLRDKLVALLAAQKVRRG